jgi:hypothetical protein
VRADGRALKYAPDFCGDREIVDIAVHSSGEALEYAPKFRGDPDIVMTAITHGTSAIRFSDFTDNREFALMVMEKDGEALEYLSERLQKDREIMRIAITQDPHALASSKWCADDPEMVLLALEKSRSVFRSASARLRNDRNFIIDVVKKHRSVFNCLPEIMKTDPEILKILGK